MVLTTEIQYQGCSGPFSITGHMSTITQEMSYQFVREGLSGMTYNLAEASFFSEGSVYVMIISFSWSVCEYDDG